jgi:hypothetical protein
MKKTFGLIGLLSCFASCGTGATDGSGPVEELAAQTEALTAGSAVLFVVGNTTLSAGDAAIRTRLQGLGATVTLRSATAATSADAQGKALIVISESVTSGDVNTKFRDSAVPVVCLEPALFDDFRLAGAVDGADYGTSTNQTELELTAISHPLAAGLTVPISSAAGTFAWGRPAAGAIGIGKIVGSSDRMGIFAFDTGQALTSGVAPARRVGWVATASLPTTLTKQGWQLFDAAVNWSAAGGAGTASVGKLDGMLLQMPCAGSTPLTDDCSTAGWIYEGVTRSCQTGVLDTDSAATVLDFPVTGTAGKVYNATFHFYGIMEPKDYGSGVTRESGPVRPSLANPAEPAPFATAPGSSAIRASDYTNYELQVIDNLGNTVKRYFINSDTQEGHYTFAINYERVIEIVGGGKVHVRVRDTSCRQIKNCSGGGAPCAAKARTISTTGADPSPVGLQQPGLGNTADNAGQWWFIDVKNIVPKP